MFTRRTLLKRGGYALAVAAIPLVRTARAQITGNYSYYIGPGGSDSNPGTQSSPWSITALNTKRSLYAGKSVGILPGTYNVYSLVQGAQWNAPALGVAGGTASSPTLIQATTPRAAILTGANPSGGGYPSVEAGIIGQGYQSGIPQLGNVIIDGLYITRGYQLGVAFYLQGETNEAGGATGIVIRNCEIYDIAGTEEDNVAGVRLQCVQGCLVQNNKIHSVQATSSNGQENVAGIFSYYSHGNIYEYNTIYDCNQGIRDKYYPNGGHTYRYNFIEVNGLYPLAAIGDGSGGIAGDVLSIYNNVFNVLAAGATIWNPNLWGSSSLNTGYQFYNNTCVFPSGGSGGIFTCGGSGISPPARLTHYNNVYLCSGSPSYHGALQATTGSISLSDYNLWGAGAASGTYMALAPISNPGVPSQSYNLSQWQSNQHLDTHSAAQNPSFVAAASLNPQGFQLVPGSAGSASGSTPGRAGGVSSGAVCDMGAWGGANPPSQVGCNFGPIPEPPVIISVS